MKLFIRSFLFCLLSFHESYAQEATVTIIGKLLPTADGSVIHFKKPIGHYPPSFYTDKKDTCVTKNSAFKATIPLPESGFIAVYQRPSDFAICSFYAAPGDTISFDITDKEVSFSGDNREANALYWNRKLFNNGVVDNDKVVKIFQQEQDVTKLFNRLQLALSDYTNLLDMLYKAQSITENCYQTLKAETEQRFYFWVSHIIESCLNEENKKNMGISLNNTQTEELVNLLNKYYSPFYPRYKKSDLLMGNVLTACRFIAHYGHQNLTKRTWNKYDDIFKNTIINFGVIDYAPVEEYKAAYVGDAIFMARRFQTAQSAELIGVLNELRQQYPDCPYIQPLENTFLADLSVSKKANTSDSPNERLYLYDSLTGLSGAPIRNITTIQSFNDFLKKTFPNKPVFIDFWATYCLPCIKEFRHATALHQWLKDNKIELLYVSIDADAASGLWERYIGDYNLNGYHLFAGSKFRNDVINTIQYVPKYYLYNTKGKLVEIHAKPSELENWKKEINIRLQ